MRASLLLVLMAASPAAAHIKLLLPDSFQVTDTLGDPQKNAPCGGAGVASNLVTTVTAGSQLTVSWRETILHPGHFRIGIARATADFRTPTPMLNQGGANCASSPIESNPAYPTLVDGLFPHTTNAPGNMYSTTITVPMMSCDNCTLQLMQFMSAHAPPCYYYQCARLRIVMPDAGAPTTDAGAPDAGTPPVMDAGASGPDAGTPPATGDAGVDTTDGGMHEHPEPMGCSCNSAPAALLLALPWWRRRKKS